MTADRFVDTNVLVYAMSQAPEDAVKRDRAREILREPKIGLSAQVVQEFYHAATRKSRLGISHEAAMNVISQLDLYPIFAITLELVREAADDAVRFHIGYFDAAILAAARNMECSIVYSEDLNEGQSYGGVTVVNPFTG